MQSGKLLEMFTFTSSFQIRNVICLWVAIQILSSFIELYIVVADKLSSLEIE